MYHSVCVCVCVSDTQTFYVYCCTYDAATQTAGGKGHKSSFVACLDCADGLGTKVHELLVRNLGPDWTSAWVGRNVDAVHEYATQFLRNKFGKTKKSKLKGLLELLFADIACRDDVDRWTKCRWWRGQRLLCRSHKTVCTVCKRDECLPKCKGTRRVEPKIHNLYRGWYAGRVIGPGMKPNTLEVLFDKTSADQPDDDDDYNVTQYPFFDSKTDASFIRGDRLGNGMVTMKVPEDGYTWNSQLVGATEA